MTRRLIVPLDQSEVSESALPLVRTLAAQLGAAVTLVSIVDVPSSFARYVRTDDRERSRTPQRASQSADITPQSPYGTWTGSTRSEPTERQIESVSKDTAEAERYLRKIAETFGETQVETAVRLGSPADRILEESEVRDNALIVIASHGRSGIGRAVVGSVAVRVVQGARVPVIVVRAKSTESEAPEVTSIRKVLVPVDGSTFAERAIPAVQDVFGAENLEVHVTSVVETPRFANTAVAEDYAGWLAAQITQTGSPATWDVSTGTPSVMINGAANAQDVDMIVMTTHGRTGLNRFVLGSVAERVLHAATKPLMLIPSRA